MTKAEWISTIKNTLMKIDETGIYREPLLEKHIQSVYEQMYNELYRRDKRGISKYASIIEQEVADSVSIADGIALTTKPISLPRQNGGVFDLYIDESIYQDWFLPSRDEMEALIVQLDSDYSDDKPNIYKDEDELNSVAIFWTSSEDSATEAYLYHRLIDSYVAYPKTGNWDDVDRDIAVLPIRTFTDTDGTYSLGDTGPAGGYIFYIDGTTVYEAKRKRIAVVSEWSNITSSLVGGTGTAIGTGAANTSAIIAQTGHTDSAAEECDDLYLSYGDANYLWILTDYQNYKYASVDAFNTVGMMGKLYASVLGGSVYADDTETSGLAYTLAIRMIPKFTSLSSTDEVVIPEGHEEMFIDRIIDTVKHMTPTDLINDNAIQ
jgi:hypothetical protein